MTYIINGGLERFGLNLAIGSGVRILSQPGSSIVSLKLAVLAPAAKELGFRNALAVASDGAPEDKSSKAPETKKKDTVSPDSATTATLAPIATPPLQMPVPEPKIAFVDLPAAVVSKDTAEGESSTSSTTLPAVPSNAQAGGLQAPTSSTGIVSPAGTTLVDAAGNLSDASGIKAIPETGAPSPVLHHTGDDAPLGKPQHLDPTPHTKAVDALPARADSHMPVGIGVGTTGPTAQAKQSADSTPTASPTPRNDPSGTASHLLPAGSKDTTDARNQWNSDGSAAHAKTDAATPSQPTDSPVATPAKAEPSLQALLPSSLQVSPLPQAVQGQTTGTSSATGANPNTLAGVRQTEGRQGGPAPKSKAGTSDVRSTSVANGNDANASDAVTHNLPAAHTANLPTGEQTPVTPKSVPNDAAMQQVAQAGQVADRTQAPQPADAVQPGATHAEAGLALPPAESHVAPSISGAQLIQSMQHSEMRVGMQSAEFGNISISTSLNHQALSAQISIDHSELGRALAVHMPAIEEKLSSAYGLQARVEVRDTGNGSAYSNAGQQSREGRQDRGGRATGPEVSGLAGISVPTSSSTVPTPAVSSRLDIRI